MIKVRPENLRLLPHTEEGPRSSVASADTLSTCRKQGHNLWQALQSAVGGAPFIPSAPNAGP